MSAGIDKDVRLDLEKQVGVNIVHIAPYAQDGLRCLNSPHDTQGQCTLFKLDNYKGLQW